MGFCQGKMRMFKRRKKKVYITLLLFMIIYLVKYTHITRTTLAAIDGLLPQQLLLTKYNSSSNIRIHLTELNNGTHESEIWWTKPRRIFYNRIPKCGSRTTYMLFQNVSNKDPTTFQVIKQNLSRTEYCAQMRNCDPTTSTERLLNTTPPAVVHGHIHYVDFNSTITNIEDFPVLINLLRDPFQRLVSGFYYYKNKQKQPAFQGMDFSECVKSNIPDCVNITSRFMLSYLPFFCGSEPDCELKPQYAIQKAKQNMLKHYCVIGLLEKYTSFLEALETVLPWYFKNITTTFEGLKESKSGQENKVRHPAENQTDLQPYLQHILSWDYELYAFVEQQFTLEKILQRPNCDYKHWSYVL